MDSEPVVVAILHPPEWCGSEGEFDAAVAALEAVDPRVEVVQATYVEDHERRSARGLDTDPSLRADAPPVPDEVRAALGRAEVAVAIDLPFDVAELAPRLRWVQSVGAGTTQLQSAGLGPAGIRLTSNAGANSVGIAEFAIGRLLEAAKRFRELDALQVEHRWEPLYGPQLQGRTIGLLGYGPINRAVAVRAHAFGMPVLATRRTEGAPPEPPVEAFFAPDRLHEMLGRCDAVVAAVPETPETAGMMDAAAFRAMRPGATFVNVGRGSLVDEAALVDALRSGHLGAAAIDVAHREPLPADDPLWDVPGLAVSAHCASSPTGMFAALYRHVADNLARHLRGRSLVDEVDLVRGY
ncbi:D-2-hydroxyacid dehydrogenase [Rhabdothermincola salaria]|uniref:D-2-hydroxyacid dehydrogenase n=1 Tax=Rhabdothermincola salaria TaxID=2903142 RepID=UPI001E5F305B|nr:D-2-hydroxyacid dehydrogenase [Rhabdothermincola salaria]MCD9624357.1 D-2-hydroxyacid dehydrogenase [Rhabdothermincola salaria]